MAHSVGHGLMCSCTHRQRIASTREWLGLEPGEVDETFVAHDYGCPIYDGECCCCLPRIIMTLSSGEQICIDEYGVLVTERMN